MIMIEKDQKKIWKRRASTYNNLDWVNKEELKNSIIRYGDFNKNHIVLDGGTGTGVIASLIAPHVKEVYGIDISPEMLSLAKNEKNMILEEGDMRDINHPENKFDRVVSRNVFHNILSTEDRLKSAKECYRVLKNSGKFIFQEGVPPNSNLKKDFEEIFSLKETRVVFLPEDIENLLIEAGFKKIETHIIIDSDFDLNNWLDNDGTLDETTKKKIIDLHLNSTPEFKKYYNLRKIDDKVLIDTRVAIVIGEKL